MLLSLRAPIFRELESEGRLVDVDNNCTDLFGLRVTFPGNFLILGILKLGITTDEFLPLSSKLTFFSCEISTLDIEDLILLLPQICAYSFLVIFLKSTLEVAMHFFGESSSSILVYLDPLSVSITSCLMPFFIWSPPTKPLRSNSI